jgi:deoxyribonuclease V
MFIQNRSRGKDDLFDIAHRPCKELGPQVDRLRAVSEGRRNQRDGDSCQKHTTIAATKRWAHNGLTSLKVFPTLPMVAKHRCVVKREPRFMSLPVIPDLVDALRRLIDQVPRGRVTTPGALASALGNSIAARWVGHYLLHHEHDTSCVCHRVVRAGGVLGAYPQGNDEKVRRLQADGVAVVDGVVDLDLYGFLDFTSGRPLEKLARYQNRVAAKISLRPRLKVPKLLGGVDVSYASPSVGVAAYAQVNVATGELLWSTTIHREIRFPYISSYLTFRELPLLIDLLDEVHAQGKMTTVIMVDGTGVLHPRQAGIASHLGVVTGMPTIGVMKKLLCGQVDISGLQPLESRPVLLHDQCVGLAIRPTSGSRRPLFVSPGNGLNLSSAEQIVRAVLKGRRLPLPLYWADRLSRQHAKILRES